MPASADWGRPGVGSAGYNRTVNSEASKHLLECIRQTPLFKVTYIAFKEYISVHAFPENQTHNVGIGRAHALIQT